MRAALYIRVSTGRQVESGLSLEDQERRGRAFAASKDWEIAEVFVEGASARDGKARPVFDDLMARAGDFGAVIFNKIDRLGRSAREILGTYDSFEQQGVYLVVLEGGIDTSNAAGRMLRTILAAFAEFESDKISERTAAATNAKVRRGQHHGKPPYGYVLVDGELLPHASEAAIVERIFREFADGASQRQIARTLNDEGAPTKKPGSRWTQAYLARLLRNPIYVGRVRINGTEFDGRHEALIDPELWERAQTQLATRHRRPGRPTNGAHLFTRGLLRCAHCGYGMGVRKDSHQNGAETYVCLGRVEHGPAFCPQTPIPREAVDVAAFEYFQQVGLDQEQARIDLEHQLDSRLREARLLREDQLDLIARLRSNLDRWDSMLADGELEADEWRRLTRKTREELEPAEGRIQILNARVEELEASDIPTEAREEVLRRLAELRAAVAGEIAGAEGLDQVRAQLRRLFDRFDAGRTDLEADPAMPAEMRAEREAALEEARASKLASPDGTWIIIPWPRSEVVEPLEYAWTPPLRSTSSASSPHTSPWPPFLGVAPAGWRRGRGRRPS